MERSTPALAPGLGQLLRRAALPEGVSCLAPLGDGCVAAGTPAGVEVVSWGGSKPARASGFSAECLATLGSQSLAAGDAEGRVRVWHLRRGALKQVFDVSVHTKAVRALANAGDVLLTASQDGTVRLLDVLAGFAPTEFAFSADVAVGFVAASGRFAVLVGCDDGRVVEVHRKTSEQMRCMQLGPNLIMLASDEADGRVLAAGGGRLEVWRMPAPGKGRRAIEVGLGDPVLLGSWSAPNLESALLLPGGGAEDFVLGTRGGLLRGPSESPVVQEAAVGPQRVGAMAFAFHDGASSPDTAFLVLGGGARSPNGKNKNEVPAELFELELPRPINSIVPDAPADASESRTASLGAQGSAVARGVGGASSVLAGAGARLVFGEATQGEARPASCDSAAPATAASAGGEAIAQGRATVTSPSHSAAAGGSHYWHATEASRSRAEAATRTRT